MSTATNSVLTGGSIRRSEAGDVEVTVNVFRNGNKLQSSEGADDIYDFITGIEIYESITS